MIETLNAWISYTTKMNNRNSRRSDAYRSKSSLASRQNNQQIEPEHLLSAMPGESEGITSSILRKPGGVPSLLRQFLGLFSLPVRVSGSAMSGSAWRSDRVNTEPVSEDEAQYSLASFSFLA